MPTHAACRPPCRPVSRLRPRAAGAWGARRCLVESFEPRVLFHLEVQTPLPDRVVGVNSAPVTIDLYQNIFDETGGPTVRLDYGSVGQVDILMLEKQAPLSVANFLKYVNDFTFNNTVVHRSEPGFVVQGGGFRPDTSDISPPGTPTVQNEFSPSRSNLRGTIAYAKIGPQPGQQPTPQTINSATTEWFFNLADNSSNLDGQNGGFTVFAKVLGSGMTVVDAIAALPRTDASALNGAWNHMPVTNTSLPTLPSTSTPTAADMVVLQNASVVAPAVTYSVTSSNTALVTPSVNGNNLTLTYGAQQLGSATITVTATTPDGASTQDTFLITVGATPVGLGQGANAQQVTFTDADGTTATVRVAGGAATLSFDGQNITQTPSGRNVTVGGTGLQLLNVALTGPNPNATITAIGGGDGKIVINGITADGPVRGVTGRNVVLKGTSTFNSPVGRLNFTSAEAANILIMPDVTPGVGVPKPSITIGTATDTDIQSGLPLTLRLGSWTGTTGDADTITAPAVRSMVVKGDFTGDLNVSGNGQPPGSPALNSARVTGGVASGTWNVGKASRISLGSTGAGWTGNFGDVANFTTTGDLAGTLTANSINVLNAASLTGATINLNLPAAALAVGLGRLLSRGAITNSVIRSQSSIGTVTAALITGSSIYAGVTAIDGGVLPSGAGEFASDSTIRGVTVRNRGTTPAFINTDIAAANIGRVSLGAVQVSNGGVPFGLAANSIASLSAVGGDGALIRRTQLDDPAESLDLTDFKVRIF